MMIYLYCEIFNVMANAKISQLPDADSLNDTDIIPVVQNEGSFAVTRKVPVSMLKESVKGIVDEVILKTVLLTEGEYQPDTWMELCSVSELGSASMLLNCNFNDGYATSVMKMDVLRERYTSVQLSAEEDDSYCAAVEIGIDLNGKVYIRSGHDQTVGVASISVMVYAASGLTFPSALLPAAVAPEIIFQVKASRKSFYADSVTVNRLHKNNTDYSYELPDKSGTLALLSDIGGNVGQVDLTGITGDMENMTSVQLDSIGLTREVIDSIIEGRMQALTCRHGDTVSLVRIVNASKGSEGTMFSFQMTDISDNPGNNYYYDFRGNSVGNYTVGRRLLTSGVFI